MKLSTLVKVGEPYLTRSREDIDTCGMVVYSELYIPVSSNHFPCSSTDPNT